MRPNRAGRPVADGDPAPGARVPGRGRRRRHRPALPDVRAGQHGLWLVPRDGVAAFTIASAPEEELITLGTTLHEHSCLKRALSALTEGDTVRFVGPLGGFTLDESAPRVVMLAQGIGITPFLAMLLHTELAGLDLPTTLVHVGTRHPFRSDTRARATTASYPTSREDFATHVQEVAADAPDPTFMISGTSAFVSSTAALLTERAIAPTLIKQDAFCSWSPDHS